MHVVFVNATRRFGGVKTWTLDLSPRLEAMGHRVTIFCRPGPFADKALALDLNARTMNFGMDFNPVAIMKFYGFFKREKASLVMCNVGKDMRTAGIAARLAGVPVVQRVGLPRDMRDCAKVRLTNALVRPMFLVPCAHIRDGLIEELPFLDPDEIKVVHTGKQPAEKSPDRVAVPKRIIITSQLNADKGHADLLMAMAACRDAGLDFTCTVLGTGREETTLKDLCTRLDLDSRVEWTGFQKDVGAYLSRSDIFVLASYSEGLPNTLMEAMAHGLAPLARDVGGVAEVWPDHAALKDMLIPATPGPDVMAARLKSLLTMSENEFVRVRRAVWAWLDANFSLDGQARLIADWLENVAHKKMAKEKTAGGKKTQGKNAGGDES